MKEGKEPRWSLQSSVPCIISMALLSALGFSASDNFLPYCFQLYGKKGNYFVEKAHFVPPFLKTSY